jgi:iron-sulfur cluster assembly protein
MVPNTDQPDQLVTLTNDAALKVRELLAREPDATEQALRLAVHEGCCSGYAYALGFDQARADDYTVSSEGVTVLVDPESAPLVRGSQIDFVLDLQHSGFKVENPQASSTCRCGQGFEHEHVD